MTITVKNIIPAKVAEATQQTQYQAVNCKLKIDKFTVTNTTAGNVTFSCNLVPPNDTAGPTNLIIKARAIAPNETYTCPELTGQSLESNGVISTIASAADSLVICASGREIT